MTSKIRKLYNVLVVGGAMAAGVSAGACSKDDAKKPDPPAAKSEPAPAKKAADPAPAAQKPEPVETDTTTEKDKDGKPVVKKKEVTKAADKPLTPADPKADPKAATDDKGSGAKGWS